MTRPVAVVTGGSSNIGWACVQRFADTHTVVIGDLRPPAEALPAHVHYRATDITDEASCAALLSAASAHGAVAAVVHSAAITAPARPIAEITAEEWRRLIDVNLTGAFLVARAALPALRAARGALVMVSSRAARVGYAALSPTPAGTKPHYAASKAAVLSLVKSLAVELAPDGIRVNALAPGVIETPMTAPTREAPEKLQKFMARTPMGRVGQAEELVGPVVFLASPMASYVTGVTLPVDGGFLAA